MPTYQYFQAEYKGVVWKEEDDQEWELRYLGSRPKLALTSLAQASI